MKLFYVSRPGERFPEGRGHVMEILMSILPGIDCNDVKKTMSVFQLVSIYGRLVPMVDMSHIPTSNMTPEDRKVCQQSSQFLSFVTEFMDKCFSLIENSTLEDTRQEQSSSDTHMSSEETSINTGINSYGLHLQSSCSDDYK